MASTTPPQGTMWRRTPAMNRCLPILSLLLASCVLVTANVTCEKENNCRCTMSDNSYYYDLSPMVIGTNPPLFKNISGSNATHSYTYDPCRDFSVVANGSECTNVSVCEERYDKFYNLGLHGADSKFLYEPDKPVKMRIIYPNDMAGKDRIRTTVLLLCDRDAITSLVLDEATPSFYLFDLTSPYACPQPLHSLNKITTGGIICIVFAVSVSVYFLTGIVYLFFIKHQSGTKAIPHYQFWSSLPGLIRDGCVFLCQCICGESKEITYRIM